MISEVRSYINRMAKAYNGDWIEHKDALNDDNIPSNLISDTYHISYGSISNTTTDHSVESQVDVTISIFKRGSDSMVDVMDSILDDSLCFGMSLLDSKEYYADNIKAVFIGNITPEEIDVSNDNTIKSQIELVFIKYHKIGE